MAPESDMLYKPGSIQLFLDVLREKGRDAGRAFRRLVINDDGSGEVEYEARNPWETLVVQLTDMGEFLCRFSPDLDAEMFLEKAVIRKKCTKCFLHQREVTPGDI